MILALESPPLPLRLDEHGTVRIGRTRVTLDTVVRAFQNGATAEEILQGYPSLDLADVYAVIGYYLRHELEVDAYLADQSRDAAQVREQIERDFPTRDIRERLLARQRARRAE